jgi:acyl carrier protein
MNTTLAVILLVATISVVVVGLFFLQGYSQKRSEKRRNEKLKKQGCLSSLEVHRDYYNGTKVDLNTIEIIRAAVAKHANIPDPELIYPGYSFINDLWPLGFDGLGSITLMMALEEELQIKIDDEDAERLQTVDDVVRYCVLRKNTPSWSSLREMATEAGFKSAQDYLKKETAA